VIASEDCDSISEANFERNQQRHSLNWVVPSVDIVAHEEVISFRKLASNPKQLEQIVKLPVNVTTDSDRWPHHGHIRLVREDLLALLTLD